MKTAVEAKETVMMEGKSKKSKQDKIGKEPV
jgi:hypothetical protein